MRLLLTTSLLFVLPLVACNKGPEKIATGPAPADSHAGHGHAAMGGAEGQMPNDATHGGAIQSPHGVQGQAGEAKLIASGEIELAGDFAGVSEGWLFVSSVDPATGTPGNVAKVDVAAGTQNAAGNQVVPFSLSTSDFAMGAVSGDSINLKVVYDNDGFVESKTGNGTVIVPIDNGQIGVSVKLESKD